MTFNPVVPVALLFAAAALIVMAREPALRRALSRSVAAVLRWSTLTLAMLLLVLAAARPALGGPISPSPSADGTVNVFFVVDRSAASRVEDFGDNATRMSGIRRDMAALVERYPRARFAVISFASHAELDWPLSEDVWSLKPRIAALSPYTSTPAEALFETSATAGSGILRYELEQTSAQFPGSTNLVFYFGSGAAGSRAEQGTFDLGSASVSGGAVLGYGTPAGGPVPAQMVDGQVVYLVDTPGGTPVQSAIDEPRLRAIADQLGLPYVHRDAGQDLAAADFAIDDAPGSLSRDAKHVELYWALSLAAAALLLVEIYLTIRRYRRNRVVRPEVEQ